MQTKVHFMCLIIFQNFCNASFYPEKSMLCLHGYIPKRQHSVNESDNQTLADKLAREIAVIAMVKV